MGGWTGFLITYLLGGLDLLPLVILTVFAHAYLTLRTDRMPKRNRDAVADAANTAAGGPGSIVQPGDDLTALEAVKAAGKDDATAAATKRSAQRVHSMGINAKPIERSTPTGSTNRRHAEPERLSDHVQEHIRAETTPGPLDNRNGLSQRPKNAGNVFYVVLRYATPLRSVCNCSSTARLTCTDTGT
ncbi:hypothetical protein BDP55DRAFT_639518 [Colletotrichum godetiae]|uniref:Uncharacterized protein n=1 Tax=Colletotrichum godetiae TaxID=1209918 RepID=A0AAJ0A7M7_9PEZI|nr:uncharacterized protein BDP55DRAFT_639518 [Colletotrichum godetiae]KAK1656561.1 hypothetical protein BDP55DRAFT_639518 [Colletotrichum godetiae]